MKLPIRAAVRWLFLGLCGIQALAFGVGWLSPPRSTLRKQCSTRPMVLNDSFVSTRPGRPVLVDPDTIAARGLEIGEDEHLDYASCSPWKDERGERQVVGLWYRTTGRTIGQLSREFGLVRCTFPSGRVLDRIATEILPQSPPCWFPGGRARVLIPAQDGRLYRFSFESDHAADAAAVDEPAPVRWLAGDMRDAPVEIGDLVWPADPRLDGRLLASMRMPEKDERGRMSPGGRQLWWLRLNPAGSAVIEASRLAVPSPGDGQHARLEERFPAVGTAADGSLLMAYLAVSPVAKPSSWQLRVVPLELDPATCAPRFRPSRSRTLARQCAPVAPVFSTGSQRILCLSYTSQRETRLSQLALGNQPATILDGLDRLTASHRPLSSAEAEKSSPLYPEHPLDPSSTVRLVP